MLKMNEETKDNLKLLGVGLLAALVIFIGTNWNFFWQNLRFVFVKPAPVTIAPIIVPLTLSPSNPPPPAPSSTPSGSGSIPSSPSPIKYDPAGTLIIESLGIKAPIMNTYEATERQFQAALIDGVVHYPGTAGPGQVGNDYIFGHSSDYIWSKGHYKTVFALLPKIQVGAQVILFDLAGNKYTYKVTSTKIVVPSDTSVLSQNTGGKKILTVQTSYPVGTALKRFVAICELTQ